MLHTSLPSHIHSRSHSVLDSSMHYLESGTGKPLVFLHGNPTYSYLWRNVIPHLAPKGRCLAVDYIGMGMSGKPAIGYRLIDQMAYLDALFDALDLHDITFVAHDWGVALGLWYARRNPQRVRAIAFMEGHIHPIARWSDFDAGSEAMFRQLRSEDAGRRMIIDENFFIEAVLPGGIQRTLSENELDAYRAPFRDPASRLPIWRWVNEIPIAGQPADVDTILAENQRFLAESHLPKLLLYAEPGAVIQAEEVAWCQSICPNLTSVNLGSGMHFLPEDHPNSIGHAVAQWLDNPSSMSRSHTG